VGDGEVTTSGFELPGREIGLGLGERRPPSRAGGGGADDVPQREDGSHGDRRGEDTDDQGPSTVTLSFLHLPTLAPGLWFARAG
jgi:hypothetical protein